MSSHQANLETKLLEEATTPESQAFDYASLDLETRAMVQQCTSEIKNLTKRSAFDTIQIGQSLTLVKQRLKHGQYGEWLRTEFDWSEQAARQFIHVAQWAKTTNFVDLSFDLTALYHLARPFTPEAARQEAIQRARQGETITYSKAQKIIDRHKNPPIFPEVLPSLIPAVHKETAPSVTITVKATPPSEPSKEEGQFEEKSLVDVQEASRSQNHPNVNPRFNYLGELEGDPGSEECTQSTNGLQAEPAIKVLSIDVDASKLQESTLQVFEVVSPGIRIRFQSQPGTAVSLFQQLKEFPSSVIAA